MDSEYIQEYVFKLPNNINYGIQRPEHNEWTCVFNFIRIGDYTHRIPAFMSYEQAVQYYNATEGPIRLVRFSRYLVDSKPIVLEVHKWKQ